MSVSLQEIKAFVRRRMLETRSRPVWATLIFWLLAVALLFLVLKLSGYLDFLLAVYEDFQAELVSRETSLMALDRVHLYAVMYAMMESAVLRTPYPAVAPAGFVLAVLVLLMAGVLLCGHTFLCMQAVRSREIRYRDLFEGFRAIFRVSAVLLIRTVLTAAGCLLLLVPGILLWYRWRFAVYVLFDEPELGPVGVLRESARRSKGYRGRLFLLDLSFIGWYLLGYIVTALLSLPILKLWNHPYRQMTRAELYDRVIGWTEEPEDEPGPGYDPDL